MFIGWKCKSFMVFYMLFYLPGGCYLRINDSYMYLFKQDKKSFTMTPMSNTLVVLGQIIIVFVNGSCKDGLK